MSEHIEVVVSHYDDRGDPDPPNNYRAEIRINGQRWVAFDDQRWPVTKEEADALASRTRTSLENWKKS